MEEEESESPMPNCTTPAVVAALFVGALPVADALAETAYDGRYLDVARRYADAMLDHGRDTYGPTSTGLFLSALDRTAPGGPRRYDWLPAAAEGIRQHDRVWNALGDHAQLTGANPGHDQQLYQLLYGVGDATGDARYARAADDALGWFFNYARSPTTDLLAWGEHASWDPDADAGISGQTYDRGGRAHEFFEGWPLWQQSNGLAPHGVDAFALGLWDHQIQDQADGRFNRDAPWGAGDFSRGESLDFPRHAGFYLNTWGHAIADRWLTGSDATLLHASDVLLGRYEGKRAAVQAQFGGTPALLPFTTSDRPRAGVPEKFYSGLGSNAELSIGATEAADALSTVGDPAVNGLIDRLRAFGDVEDGAYFGFDHDPAGEGLVSGADVRDRRVLSRLSRAWGRTYKRSTMAGEATILMDRHAQLAASPDADRRARAEDYAGLLMELADFYRRSDPDGTNGEAPDGDYWDEPLWPGELADAIDLELWAFGRTGEPWYLDRAGHFAEIGRRSFFRNHDLPRTSGIVPHYESITGGDDLALSLLALDRVLRDSGRGIQALPVPEPGVAGVLATAGVLASRRRRSRQGVREPA